jgi:hypothetical protein
MNRPLLVALLLAACSRSQQVPSPADAGSALPAGASTRADLRWKRFRVMQGDLARALALGRDEVCHELGIYPCATTKPVTLTDFIRSRGYADPAGVCAVLQGGGRCNDGPLIDVAAPTGVHIVALGGNDVFFREQYDPLPEPNVITPLAVERVVLSACARAVARDRAGPAKVFSAMKLDDTPSAPGTPGLTALVSTLYRRLLARDPNADEIAAMAELTTGATPPTTTELAKLACFAVATTTEFIWQ